MLYNLIWELNKRLNFTLNIDDKQSVGTGDEVRALVSKDIIRLTGEDINTVLTVCKKYNIRVVRWVFSTGIEEKSKWDYLTGKRINILTLDIRPILKWE